MSDGNRFRSRGRSISPVAVNNRPAQQPEGNVPPAVVSTQPAPTNLPERHDTQPDEQSDRGDQPLAQVTSEADDTKHDEFAGKSSKAPGKVLGCFRLRDNVTEDEVHKLFANFGKVERVVIVKNRGTNISRGFGFITMESIEAATKAKNGLDNTSFQGRVIRVDYGLMQDWQDRGPPPHRRPRSRSPNFNDRRRRDVGYTSNARTRGGLSRPQNTELWAGNRPYDRERAGFFAKKRRLSYTNERNRQYQAQNDRNDAFGGLSRRGGEFDYADRRDEDDVRPRWRDNDGYSQQGQQNGRGSPARGERYSDGAATPRLD
ncbi:hypothetical protein HK104_001942 [Borealophlyctis nickersoniae]|nr:hypothetical protein HK104_001942 [Borealophlyctis nickersoniae]